MYADLLAGEVLHLRGANQVQPCRRDRYFVGAGLINNFFTVTGGGMTPAIEAQIEILSDALVRTLLALEVAYEYKAAMPEHVVSLLEQRIEDARESC